MDTVTSQLSTGTSKALQGVFSELMVGAVAGSQGVFPAVLHETAEDTTVETVPSFSVEGLAVTAQHNTLFMCLSFGTAVIRTTEPLVLEDDDTGK